MTLKTEDIMVPDVILSQTAPYAIIYDHILRRRIVTSQSNFKNLLQFGALELFQKI